GPRIGFPIKIEVGAGYSRVDIIGTDGKTAIQKCSFIGVTPQKPVFECDLLKSVQIVGIQFERALKIAQAFLVLPLARLDEAGQLQDSRIVRQRLAGRLKLGNGTIVIHVAAVEIFPSRKVRFAGVGTQAECCLNRSVRQRQPRGSVIKTQEIELVVGVRELAVSKGKRWITRDG